MHSIQRYHDISCGHRVAGHESKCALLHGHNYRITFEVRAVEDLDAVGRVLDFSVVKSILCQWLEDNWDHKFLCWVADPLRETLMELSTFGVILVPFNPTAENMAKYLVEIVGARALVGSGTYLHSCKVEETRKCSATYTKEPHYG
jgi:6-pyruvoyltetrahydropterin/6-carboxytetrahydropterin synthase